MRYVARIVVTGVLLTGGGTLLWLSDASEPLAIERGEAFDVGSLFDATSPICIFGDHELLYDAEDTLPPCEITIWDDEVIHGNAFIGLRGGKCRTVRVASEPGKGLRPGLGCARYGPDDPLHIRREADGSLVWQDD